MFHGEHATGSTHKSNLRDNVDVVIKCFLSKWVFDTCVDPGYHPSFTIFHSRRTNHALTYNVVFI